MADSPESLVKRLLRSSEEVKVALEASRKPNAREDPDLDTDINDRPDVYQKPSDTQPQDSPSAKHRIIAVVVHVDSSTGDEQAWSVRFLCSP